MIVACGGYGEDPDDGRDWNERGNDPVRRKRATLGKSEQHK